MRMKYVNNTKGDFFMTQTFQSNLIRPVMKCFPDAELMHQLIIKAAISKDDRDFR